MPDRDSVTAVSAPPTVRTPPWDGTLSAYATIRHMVPTGPHGRPGFIANMLTASEPGPASLWDGRAWVQVPLGAVVEKTRDAWPRVLTPEEAQDA